MDKPEDHRKRARVLENSRHRELPTLPDTPNACGSGAAGFR